MECTNHPHTHTHTHTHTHPSTHTDTQCKTPEQVGPVATTPDGLHVLAGGRSGRIYVWEAASGSLLRAWDAHFKAVTCLALSGDGGVLFSGAEDTLVKAWAMGEVLAGGGGGGAAEHLGAAGAAGMYVCMYVGVYTVALYFSGFGCGCGLWLVDWMGGCPRDQGMLKYLCLIFFHESKTKK
jgi:hypothetical protein